MKNKNPSVTPNIMQAIRATKGRFFGLVRTNGVKHNAQFRQETPKTITIWDNNLRCSKQIRKSDIVGVVCG